MSTPHVSRYAQQILRVNFHENKGLHHFRTNVLNWFFIYKNHLAGIGKQLCESLDTNSFNSTPIMIIDVGNLGFHENHTISSKIRISEEAQNFMKQKVFVVLVSKNSFRVNKTAHMLANQEIEEVYKSLLKDYNNIVKIKLLLTHTPSIRPQKGDNKICKHDTQKESEYKHEFCGIDDFLIAAVAAHFKNERRDVFILSNDKKMQNTYEDMLSPPETIFFKNLLTSGPDVTCLDEHYTMFRLFNANFPDKESRVDVCECKIDDFSIMQTIKQSFKLQEILQNLSTDHSLLKRINVSLLSYKYFKGLKEEFDNIEQQQDTLHRKLLLKIAELKSNIDDVVQYLLESEVYSEISDACNKESISNMNKHIQECMNYLIDTFLEIDSPVAAPKSSGKFRITKKSKDMTGEKLEILKNTKKKLKEEISQHPFQITFNPHFADHDGIDFSVLNALYRTTLPQSVDTKQKFQDKFLKDLQALKKTPELIRKWYADFLQNLQRSEIEGIKKHNKHNEKREGNKLEKLVTARSNIKKDIDDILIQIIEARLRIDNEQEQVYRSLSKILISLSAWQFATDRSEFFARHQSHR